MIKSEVSNAILSYYSVYMSFILLYHHINPVYRHNTAKTGLGFLYIVQLVICAVPVAGYIIPPYIKITHRVRQDYDMDKLFHPRTSAGYLKYKDGLAKLLLKLCYNYYLP